MCCLRFVLMSFFSADNIVFTASISRLTALTGKNITCFADFEQAIEERVKYFHDVGGRVSDHGLCDIVFVDSTPQQIESIFQQKFRGEETLPEKNAAWNSALFIALARMYKKYHWAMQIHFGSIRNNNHLMLEKVGINSGFDSVSDQSHLAMNLNAFFDAMEKKNILPKTIIYNIYAAYNDIVASTIANFQSGDDGIKSPVQFGSGWWFNDTRRGMLNQLTTLADQGLLMNFIGMLTDSRSFVSYPRHDYFRRILCGLLGQWVESGEFPCDGIILERMVKNICHDNAAHYFAF